MARRSRLCHRAAAQCRALCCVCVAALPLAAGCSSDGGAADDASGGKSSSAGAGGDARGGTASANGGASNATGGETGTGEQSGGNAGDGGASASGDGGNRARGGASGASTSGGAGSSAGGANSGGRAGSGGNAGANSGGRAGSGGNAGANSGGANSGGASGANSGGNGGSAGASAGCKRGIAANVAPGAAFSPSVTWWYNWSMAGSGAGSAIEFVPMVWGSGSLTAAIPTGSKYVLTFNEPNFHAQSNLTAAQAAGYWPMIEAKAKAAHVPIVGPGMNFCGPAASCNGTSPYQYLKDFFAACTGCEVDYVAVHWYNCDLPSLKDYLEPGGNLEGFEQFGRPIWLTEFSCNGSASASDQETFMRAAIPYLESNPHVFRYSWFSAGPIPNAKLVNDDGSPTALGKVYASLPQNCP